MPIKPIVLLLMLSGFLLGCSKTDKCNDAEYIYSFAQVFVQNSMKSPSTADVHYKPTRHTNLGNCRHKFNSYVDAENEFGARLRQKFSVIVEYNEISDKYELEEINFY